MLTSRPCLLRVLVKGMRSGNGQRSNGNRTAHEEENFVHGDSQSDA